MFLLRFYKYRQYGRFGSLKICRIHSTGYLPVEYRLWGSGRLSVNPASLLPVQTSLLQVVSEQKLIMPKKKYNKFSRSIVRRPFCQRAFSSTTFLPSAYLSWYFFKFSSIWFLVNIYIICVLCSYISMFMYYTGS